jgi:hypothetical protein
MLFPCVPSIPIHNTNRECDVVPSAVDAHALSMVVVTTMAIVAVSVVRASILIWIVSMTVVVGLLNRIIA